jgi:hypothetical protein
MSNMQQYEEILQTGWSELPDEQYLPDGSFRFEVISAKVLPPRSEDQSAVAMFALEPKEAMSDVSDDAMAALGEEFDLSDHTIFHKIWLKKPSDWHRLQTLIEKCGVDPKKYATKEESLKACKRAQIVGYVVTKVFTDKATGAPRQQNEVQSFAQAA